MVQPIVEVRQPGGEALSIVVDRRLELGREALDVLLNDPLASRRHAALVPGAHGVTIEDLGSSNGTLLNGQAITAPVNLHPGDVAMIGDTEVTLSGLVAQERPAAPPAAAPVVDDVRGTTIRRGGFQAPPAPPPSLPGPGSVPSVPTVPPPPPLELSVVRPPAAHAAPAVVASPPPDLRATSIERVAAVVVNDEEESLEAIAADLRESGLGGGQRSATTLTIAFSDIEESTQQAEAMGDHRWYRALIAHNAIIEELVSTYKGSVIKSVGDGFMITFTSAGRATRWAVAVQRQITAYGIDHPDEAVRVRLGLHTGEAIEANGDLFGIHVNTAARIANLATGGQIMVSSLTRAIAAPAGDFDFGPEQPVALKGLSGSYSVCELLWAPEPETAPSVS